MPIGGSIRKFLKSPNVSQTVSTLSGSRPPVSGLGPTATAPPAGPLDAATGAYGGGSNDFLAQLLASLGPAPQAPSFDPKQMALDLIAQQYGAQEGSLERARKNTQSAFKTQEDAQRLYGQGADTRLQQLYDALQNDLYRGQDATARNYNQASQAVRGSYDEATQSLNTLNESIIGRLLNSASDLGIEQGAGTPLAQLQQQFATMAGTNLQNEANSLSGLNQDQANFLGLGQAEINSSRKRGVQARQDVQTQVQQALAQLGLAGAQAETEFQGQITDLEKGKAADYRTTLSQLGQQQYEQQRQSRLDQLAELIQLGTLDTQRQHLGLEGQVANQNYQLGLGRLGIQQGQLDLNSELGRARLDVEIQKLQSDLAKENDPYKRAQIEAQINHLNAQTNYLNNGGAKGSQGPFNDVLLRFLSSPQAGLWGTEGAGPKFQDALYNPTSGLFNKAAQQADMFGVDPFTYATGLVTNPQQGGLDLKNLDLNGLLRALQLYYKGQ